MCLLDIIAILATEPFNLPIEQIKRLTLFQVMNVYFRARTPKGALIPLPDLREDPLNETQRVALKSVATNTPTWFIRSKYGPA